MNAALSPLDRPAARGVAMAVAAAALAAALWLVYLDNREDPALAACIANHTAAIAAARDKGALTGAVAARFLARVAESCEAQIGGPSR